jgi:lysophospholipase L1-like esterase
MKKLNTKGFAHWLIPALALVVIGGIGSYMLNASHADPLLDSENPKLTRHVSEKWGCWLAGRVWKNNACLTGKVGSNQPACRVDTGSVYKVSSAGKGYCTNAIELNVGKAKCINTLHRLYVEGVGCARRIDQKSVNGAGQCPKYVDSTNKYVDYVAASSDDHCVARAGAAALVIAESGAPGAPAGGSGSNPQVGGSSGGSPPATPVTPTPAAHPRKTVLIIGDSITAIYKDQSAHGKGWWKWLQEATDSKVVLSAQGGSGYVRQGQKSSNSQCDGTTFVQRLSAVKNTKPDYIIVEGGRNDGYRCSGRNLAGVSSAYITSAVNTYMTALVADAASVGVPASHIYAFTPWGTARPDKMNQVVPIVKRQAQAHGITFVDTAVMTHLFDGKTHPDATGSKDLYNSLVQNSNLDTVLKR